jgi:hypothetical protein
MNFYKQFATFDENLHFCTVSRFSSGFCTVITHYTPELYDDAPDTSQHVCPELFIHTVIPRLHDNVLCIYDL